MQDYIYEVHGRKGALTSAISGKRSLGTQQIQEQSTCRTSKLKGTEGQHRGWKQVYGMSACHGIRAEGWRRRRSSRSSKQLKLEIHQEQEQKIGCREQKLSSIRP